MRVAVLGCGNVGAALVDPADRSTPRRSRTRTGVRLELAGVAVADLSRPRSAGVPADLLTEDAKGLVARDDVDVVVELIGGIDPARTLVESALRGGHPVVTANKALLAMAGAELAELAAPERRRPPLRGGGRPARSR